MEENFIKPVFIHINRTGGTSIINSLELETTCNSHFTVKELESQFDSNTFTFTFVRNTWGRITSIFNFRKNIKHSITNDLTFKDWVKTTYEKDQVKKMLDTQLSWLKNKKGKIEIDFIGKYKNLQEDYNNLCKLLNRRKKTLPYLNQSVKKNYRNYYDKETKTIINNRFKEDIEFFKHKF